MENEILIEVSDEQVPEPAVREKKTKLGPLIGSEGEVSGYDWDDEP